MIFTHSLEESESKNILFPFKQDSRAPLETELSGLFRN